MPFWRLHYHIVWATRERLALIGNTEELTIERSLQLTIEDLDLVPHAIGMMPDHVHVVVSIPPSRTISEVVKRLKGASAHAVNHRREDVRTSEFRWQGDYGVLSFGDNALPRVIDYVNRQQEHHANNTCWAKLEQTDDGFDRN